MIIESFITMNIDVYKRQLPTPPPPTSNNPHNESNLWAIWKEFGVGLKFETTPETYSKLLPINMVSIILKPYIRYSIHLYEHQK